LSNALRYPVLQKAREITGSPNLDILEVRKYLGVPLGSDIQRWLAEQPPRSALFIDFGGVRAITMSVAEEVGPLLMQSVHQNSILDQRYPVYIVGGPEPAYTLHRAFESDSWAALGIVLPSPESFPSLVTLERSDSKATVVLGQLSKQMEEILRFADERWRAGEPLTSENLSSLEFLGDVSAAARSKRLTELYARRLVAYRENPRNPRERLFTPAWRLGADERGCVAE
jgi:hypothetical protein